MSRALNPFLVDVHKFARQPGKLKHLERRVETRQLWGNKMIGLAAGSPVELSLDLEAVGEGVLVTGQARYRLTGQCGRCLIPVRPEAEVRFQELFLFLDHGEDDPDLSRTDGQTLDLEPLIRDAVVLDLPWTPVCEDDCQGLCVECGVNLNKNPSHAHTGLVDARWSKLVGWVPSGEVEPGDRN